jgi:hypothetical protein
MMHIFRQAHVASNIEFFLRDGISLAPAMYAKNTSDKLLDFPLYQQIVTVLCNTFKTPVIQTGRGVNIVVYMLNCFALWGILHTRCKFAARVVIATILLYSLSPLSVFYERAIIPDNLAILLSLLSLWCFLWWVESDAPVAFVGMTLTGVLATLIKNPIYLPVCFVIGFWFIFHRQVRRLFSLKMLFFAAVIAATVVIFKLYANFENTGSLQSPGWESQWYFSTLKIRLSFEPYNVLFQRLVHEIVVPPIFGLLFLGLCSFLFEAWHPRQKAVVLGLTIGGVVTALLFFNVNLIHNYYQLPFVPIACFFAAYAWDRLLGRRMVAALQSRRVGTVGLGVVCLLLCFGALFVVTRGSLISKTEPAPFISSGDFIRQNTSPDTFVLFVISQEDWNPAFLYFAKREGYNLGVDNLSLSSSLLRETVERFGKSYPRISLFVPRDLFGVVGGVVVLPPYADSISDAGAIFNLR